MNNQIKSSIILIDNIIYELNKFTRKLYAEKLKKERLPFSPSSINRILKFLEDDFGITVKFQRNEKAKIIEDESDPNYLEKIRSYKNLFFRNNLEKSLIENQVFNQYISFGFNTQNKNVQYIEPILNAITTNQKIKFTYKPFQENEEKIYFANPLFLKEYLNRWYFIAETESSPNRVFAIDRILEIAFLNKKFKLKQNIKYQLYKDTIGVNFSGQPKQVILWVALSQYPYIETLPIHISQKLIEKSKEGAIISLTIVVNFELERLLLSYGNRIKVIEPKTLKETIKNELKETLSYY